MKYLVSFLLLSSIAFSKTISLMAYNVENLFDTIHDEGKNDYTYLPLSLKNESPHIQAICQSLGSEWWIKECLETDWNENVLDKKMQALSKVILSYNNGEGADILALEEVENLNVVSDLQKNYLKGKYSYVALIEGEDARGIDTAVISKYPIIKSELHNINLEAIAKKTRGILEVDIKIGNKKVSVLVNHWPSQANPSQARLLAAKKLEQIALNSKAELVIAVGDFNTLPTDLPNAIDYLMNKFTNAAEEAQRRGIKLAQEGSHWYKTQWSTLDKILVYKKSDSQALYESYNIHVKDWMTHTVKWFDQYTGKVSFHEGVPLSFNIKTFEGFSDHLPIVMKFNI